VDTTRIPPAGDPFTSSPPSTRTTRHHRCTPDFLELLQEDFDIPYSALHAAFMGIPREPKKEAIALAEWAARTDNPTRALLAWARKNHRGTFRPDVAGDDE
jgi:hypothetical protein